MFAALMASEFLRKSAAVPGLRSQMCARLGPVMWSSGLTEWHAVPAWKPLAPRAGWPAATAARLNAMHAITAGKRKNPMRLFIMDGPLCSTSLGGPARWEPQGFQNIRLRSRRGRGELGRRIRAIPGQRRRAALEAGHCDFELLLPGQIADADVRTTLRACKQGDLFRVWRQRDRKLNLHLIPIDLDLAEYRVLLHVARWEARLAKLRARGRAQLQLEVLAVEVVARRDSVRPLDRGRVERARRKLERLVRIEQVLGGCLPGAKP